jgi:long-subunit acyl-CoA synthetase (AMP-forming)
MRLNNICGFNDLPEFVSHKLSEYEKEEKNFESLFRYMFCESENVMAEFSVGYKIKKITYGEVKDRILNIAPVLARKIGNLPPDSIVGLYMSNSIEWIEMFWSILMCGYRPLLMNSRLSDSLLCEVIDKYSVAAVVSDGKSFPVNTILVSDIRDDVGGEKLCRRFGSEIIFMSSGTTDNIKLCAYNGENLY